MGPPHVCPSKVHESASGSSRWFHLAYVNRMRLFFCLPSSPRFPVALRFSRGLSIPLIEASGTSRGAPPPPSNNVLSLLGEPGPGRRFPFSLFPDFPDGAPSRLPVEGARERFRFISVVSPGLRQSHATVFLSAKLPSIPRGAPILSRAVHPPHRSLWDFSRGPSPSVE